MNTEAQIVITQWQCQQLLHRTMNLMDNQQWEALSNCYTKDAELIRPSDPTNSISGRENIKASFFKRPPRTSCHMLANCEFEIANSGEVYAVSKVMLISSNSVDQKVVKANSKLMIGTFRDILINIEGKWFIKKRKGSVELKYDYQN